MMRLSRMLAPGEEIVAEARTHAGALVRPTLWFVIVVAVAIVVGTVLTPATTGDPLDLALGGLAVLTSLRLVVRLLSWRATKVVLTDGRLLRLGGLLGTRTESVPLSRIAEVGLRRSPAGRLLGHGDVIVVLPGGGELELTHLAGAKGFYGRLLDALAPAGAVPVVQIDQDEEDTGPLPRVVV